MNPRSVVADHPARISIVDDERPNRQLLEVMLAPAGFLLLTAGSGAEALYPGYAQRIKDREGTKRS